MRIRTSIIMNVYCIYEYLFLINLTSRISINIYKHICIYNIYTIRWVYIYMCVCIHNNICSTYGYINLHFTAINTFSVFFSHSQSAQAFTSTTATLPKAKRSARAQSNITCMEQIKCWLQYVKKRCAAECSGRLLFMSIACCISPAAAAAAAVAWC